MSVESRARRSSQRWSLSSAGDALQKSELAVEVRREVDPGGARWRLALLEQQGVLGSAQRRHVNGVG